MIKGLIITHGNLGKELISVAEGILEEKVNLDYLDLDWKEDGSTIMDHFEKYLKKNKNKNIIVFTDMFGGSPTNICFKHMKKTNMEIITGINLPGILKFLTYRNKNKNFNEIVTIVKKGSIDGINLISEYLGEKKT
ncbi:MAG: hypothetical protein GY757_14465 [bacterium]|nr:hypothetical protein [bacterium]